MKRNHITFFENLIGKQNVFTDNDVLEKYSHDETENISILPSIVLKPCTTLDVSGIMKYCFTNNLCVTPRGAGTGLSGGAIPILNGIVLSLENMNAIILIDEKNLQVTTQPGVITEVLQNAVKEKGLFYPPDPSSRGTCFIGGNVAENSGGPRAVKYGVVKDYVLNLEIVLPNGDVMWTGSNVLKNVTGYNITQLIVGSEGTLAIITQIVLKLIPAPKHDLVLMAPFKSVHKAAEAVSAIFRAGFIPSALELMEIDAIKITQEFVPNSIIPVHDDILAHLIVEVDGNDLEKLFLDMEKISEVLESFDATEVLFAETAQQKDELWKFRRRVAEIVKNNGYTIEEDTVVPRYYLPQLIEAMKFLGQKHGFKVVCYGHAGDGNLHIRINHPTIKNSYQNPIMETILTELFEEVQRLGGTISGEHGIGLIQKKYLPIVFNDTQIQLHKAIKNVFDPTHILNPNKIF
ncbi:MAG: FAD-linked oxidase C-terminal domain-containing protein [Alphaproteobacteria bacterium]|nr:FAD-linked oxidase C-terminal domain-containing protein [Alphaproteobacteria bacterium]